jgi:hypothetical protein
VNYKYELAPDQMLAVIKWKDEHEKEQQGYLHQFVISFLEKGFNANLDVAGCLPIIQCTECKKESIIFVSNETKKDSKYLKSRTFTETINMAHAEAVLQWEKLQRRLDYALTSLNYEQQNGMFDSKFNQISSNKHTQDCLDVIWDVITALGFKDKFIYLDK